MRCLSQAPPAKSKNPRSKEMRAPSNQILLACSVRPQRARSRTWEGSCQGSSVSLLTQRWVLSHRYLRDGCELQPDWGRCRKPSQILHLLATGNAGFRAPLQCLSMSLVLEGRAGSGDLRNGTQDWSSSAFPGRNTLFSLFICKQQQLPQVLSGTQGGREVLFSCCIWFPASSLVLTH